MKTVTLTARDGFDLKPMKVSIDRTFWPRIAGAGETLGLFHGIGELRRTGYDVSPIKGHGAVCEIR